MSVKERRVPPFFQIPILLIAVLLGITGFGIGLYEQFGEGVPWWVTSLPFAGAGAALTLVVADVIKHQHLSSQHVKALAAGLSPIAVGMFAFTIGFGIFVAIALVVLSLLAAAT